MQGTKAHEENSSTDVFSILPDVKRIVCDLMIVLNEKERYIIERRFGLVDERKETLENLGLKFNVTRERIRQVEKNALSKLKRNVVTTPLVRVNEMAEEIVSKRGGVVSEDLLFAEILNKANLEKQQVSLNAIRLSLTLDTTLHRVGNTLKMCAYLRFAEITDELIELISEKGVEFLEGKDDVQSDEKLCCGVLKTMGREKDDFAQSFVLSCVELNKRVKRLPNSFGLTNWRHINPKTLKDKVMFVFQNEKKPLHFIEISNKVIEAGFDKKRVNVQAIHNELIRSNDFVLIGRGVYALKEWGYVAGTVADIIALVLQGGKVMTQDEIVAEVFKQRRIKLVTILLNLKRDERFKRVGRNSYTLA
jgi:hypothetical protein